MNKFVAQLQEDTGVTPENIVNDSIAIKEVDVDTISAATGFDVSGGTIFAVDLSDEASGVTVASLLNGIPGKIYTFIAYNGASKKLALTFTGAVMNPATLTLANGNTIVYKAFTDGTKWRIYQNNFTT